MTCEPSGAQRKVPGGKLVRMRATREGGIITRIRITGDFFVYPEEALSRIESDLEGLGLKGDEPDLDELVSAVVERSGAELVGFGQKDLAYLLRSLC